MQISEMKYLIYKKQELLQNGRPAEGFWQLSEDVKGHGTVVVETEESPAVCMRKKGIRPEEALILTAADLTLRECSALSAACVGYRNPAFPAEELYGADFLTEGFEEVDYAFLERVYQRKHGIPWRVIETERCFLREMTLSDLPDLRALYQDADDPGFLHSEEEEAEYIRAYIENMYRFYGFGMWLVKDRVTDELIGQAGFHLVELYGETLLEMGYRIAAARRRMGYAAEVCRALMAYAAGADFGFRRLHCFVAGDNHASAALLEKLGFTDCGICLRDGKSMRKYVYRL